MMLWMLWATAITALLGLAAFLGEGALRANGRQGRWAWAGGIAGALALQVWALLRPFGPGTPATGANGFLDDALAGLPVFFVDGIEVMSVSAPALLGRLEPFAVAAWVSASVILLAGLLGGLWRLRRDAKHWATGRVADLEVLVSEDFGPALVGVWSPRIVVPRWAFSLTSEALRMACVHEAEHRAARDTWLLFGGAILVGLTPWNAALWWQVVRLRQAIEVDCDRRVLNTGFSKSSYGALLLEFGSHPRGVSASVAALAHPPSLLERRLTMMMTDVKRAGPVRTAGLLSAVALLGFAACEAPAPTATQLSSDAEVTTTQPLSDTQAPARLVAAQGATITGQVTDGQTGAPISSAQVYFADLKLGSLTQRNGHYLLLNVPVGSHTLTVARIGYGTTQIEIVVRGDQTVERDLAISKAQSTEETPELTLVPMQELMSERTPGLSFSRTNEADGPGEAINIRGFSDIAIDDQPLIYLDGIRIDNALGPGGSVLDDIDPNDIESIEIIKGPAAATLYGSEASAGVIQIITKAGKAVDGSND